LIPKYGLAGAASASTIALIFEAVALYVTTLRRLGIHMFIMPIKSRSRRAQGAE